jgi:hypothetical protein
VATDGFFVACTRDAASREGKQRIREGLARRWTMKVAEQAQRIQGIAIDDKEGQTVTLTQPAQIQKLRERFFPNGARVPTILTPAHPQLQYAEEDDGYYTAEELLAQRDGKEPLKESVYRSDLGLTQYLRQTRVDVHVVLSLLGQHSTRRERVHPDVFEHLAAFLITTCAGGLALQRGPEGADPRIPMRYTAWTDASWGTSQGGRSRFGVLVVADVEVQERQGPTIAATILEKTVPSDSAFAAECVAQVQGWHRIAIVRGAADEIAGTNQGPTEDTTDHPATIMMQDNESLTKVVRGETKRSKNFRRLNRLVHTLRALTEAGIIESELVGSKGQRADGMTKIYAAPTKQWRHGEQMQGQQPAVTEMQELAKKRGARKLPQRLVKKAATHKRPKGAGAAADKSIKAAAEPGSKEKRGRAPVDKSI